MTLLDEWLEWRQGGVGASDVAAILGLSPWGSPWSVWADKVGLTPPQEPTDAMEFGTFAERAIGPWFEQRTGLVVAGQQTWCVNPEEPWMRCTVDGFVFDEGQPYAAFDSALGALEIKTTTDTAAEWAEQLPLHYQPQVQWQMAVSGMPKVWVAVLHLAFGRLEFAIHEVMRDEDDIATITEAARTFWHDHVLTGTPPATDASNATTEALSAAWDETTDEPIELRDEITVHLEALTNAKDAIKRLEESKDEHANAIKAALGEHEVGAAGGWEATWKPQDRTSIDAKALRAAHPDIADEFTKTTTSRVLRVTPPKEQ